MNNPITALLGLTALATGTAVAIFDSVPLVTDTFTGAGIGALVGGVVNYRLERIAKRNEREPSVKSNWIIVRWSCVGAVLALVIHLGAAIL